MFPNGLGASDSESQNEDEMSPNELPPLPADHARDLPPLEDDVRHRMKGSLLGEVPVLCCKWRFPF